MPFAKAHCFAHAAERVKGVAGGPNCAKSNEAMKKGTKFDAVIVDKIISENKIYNLFYQLVVNMGNYMPQQGKFRENN